MTGSSGVTGGRRGQLSLLVLAATLTAGITAHTAGSRAANARPAAAASYIAYVALERAGQVAVLRDRPWRLASRLRVSAGPHNVAASPDGRYVAVSSPPADVVTIIDARQMRVRARVRVAGRPHDVDFSGDGRLLWVTAERANRLLLVSVTTGRIVRSMAASGPPHDLAVDHRRGRLWVTIDGSSAVEVRAASTGRLLHRPTLGAAPHDVGFAAGYGSVWLSNWNSGSLTVVDAASRRVRARVRVGVEPHHFAAGAGALWVSDNAGGLLLRVDLRSGRVRERARVGSAPHHVAVAGEDVLVAVHGHRRCCARVPTGAPPANGSRRRRATRHRGGPDPVAVSTPINEHANATSPVTWRSMSARRVRSLLAATTVAAVLSYGLAGHGLPQMSSHEGMAGAAAGLCLLLATALGLAAMPRPDAHHTPVLREAAPIAVASPPPAPLDGRARASPTALQRFRN